MCKKYIILLSILSSAFEITAQLKGIFVETYYIADAKDADNEVGGRLPVGATTYRVYVQLNPGSKLMKLYGDKNHTLKFSSTLEIFNNSEDGVSLGYELTRNRLKENTVALDSWLTLGQVAKAGVDVQFGIPKTQDQNGAAGAIGIGNNIDDLLKNNTPLMGLPLTTADGLMPNPNKPANWLSQGFIDPLTNEETSVFGRTIKGNIFESNEAFIRNAGTVGVIPDSNQILIAQITTSGTLSFELNIEVLSSEGTLIKYVSNSSLLLSDETFSPLLKYPLTCGCQDPSFLEYDAAFACNDGSKCKTPIVFGCMDPLACNFNSLANYNVESLCCYIGFCNDLDLDVVCPNLPPRSSDDASVVIYPNPVTDVLNVSHDINANIETKIEIYNALGQLVHSELLSPTLHSITQMQSLLQGSYSLQVSNEALTIRKNFIKLN